MLRLLHPFRTLLLGSLGLPAVVVLLLGGNLLSYNRLSHEQEVAHISFARLHNGNHLATLEVPDGRQRFELDGDEWELDARVIKWHAWANLLGLDAAYRLERLSGRYADPHRAQLRAPRSYSLASDSWLDAWALDHSQHDWLPVLDAVYGSSVYLPIQDGVTYRVSLSQSGLLARPLPSTLDTPDAD